MTTIMNEQNNIPQPPYYSVESIAQRRAEKKEEILRSKARIQNLTQELFAPQKSKNQMDNMMQHINAGIAAYDGLMTGLKILRKVRGFFSRNKKS